MENSPRKKSAKRIPSTVQPNNEETAMVDRRDLMSFDDFELYQPADLFYAGAGSGKKVPLQPRGSFFHLWRLPTLLRIDLASRRASVRFDRHANRTSSGCRLVVSDRYA